MNSIGKPEDRRALTSTLSTWFSYATVASAATYPYASFLNKNLDRGVDWGPVLWWWTVTLGVGGALLILVHIADGRAVGQVAVAIALATYQLLAFPGSELSEIFRNKNHTSLLWVIVSVLLVLLILVVGKRRGFQMLIGTMMLALSLTSVYKAAQSQVDINRIGDATAKPTTLSNAELYHTPDVWYFVLDGHAPLDYFARETSYDPDLFEAFLTGRDFTLQRDARATYPLTYVSVSSTLEMDYIYDGLTRPVAAPFFDSLRGNNETVRTFEAAGYRYVQAYSGLWEGSRCSGREDLCLGEEITITATRRALRGMTPLPAEANRLDVSDLATANNPSAVVDEILSANVGQPSFNFIHVLNPHAPMLRAADCSIRDVEPSLTDWESSVVHEAAVRCLHSQLMGAVSEILRRDPEALIVIQGDHGHRIGLEESVAQSGGMIRSEEWFATLSAIRLPGECRPQVIPEDLTLVNTFRIVFSCLQQEEVPLLPSRLVPMELEAESR